MLPKWPLRPNDAGAGSEGCIAVSIHSLLLRASTRFKRPNGTADVNGSREAGYISTSRPPPLREELQVPSAEPAPAWFCGLSVHSLMVHSLFSGPSSGWDEMIELLST